MSEIKDQEKVFAEVESKGFEVIKGNPNRILLDIDSDEGYKQYTKMLPMAKELFGVKIEAEWLSKSGYPHRHVVLTSEKKFTPNARLVIQACLGSDPKKELLCLKQALDGTGEPSALFKPPPAKSTIKVGDILDPKDLGPVIDFNPKPLPGVFTATVTRVVDSKAAEDLFPKIEFLK